MAQSIETVKYVIRADNQTTAAFRGVQGGLDRLDGGFKTLSNSLLSMRGLLATVVTGALATFVKSQLNAADALAKAATRTGIAVEQLSELQFAAKLAGIEQGSLTTALGFFNKSLVEGSNQTSKLGKIFAALGVDIRQGPNEAFRQFAERAGAIEDATIKTAVMREAMGRGGDALIPMIGNLREMTDQARSMGAVMSGETARAAERFNDSIEAITGSLKIMAINAAGPSVSALATIGENLARAASKGELLNQVIRETIKITASLLGGMAGGPGGPGRGVLGEQMFMAANQAPSGILERIAAANAAKAGNAPGGDALRAAISGTGATSTGNRAANDEVARQKSINNRILAGYAEFAATMKQDDKALAQFRADLDTEDFKLRMDQIKGLEDALNIARQNEIDLIEDSHFAALQYLVQRSTEYNRLQQESDQRLAAEAKKSGDQLTEYSLQAARNMQSAMATGFFDIMEGRFDNLANSFSSMLNRMAAEMAASKLSGFLFGDFGRTGKLGGAAGGWVDAAVRMLGGGSTASGAAASAELWGDMAAANGADFTVGGASGVDRNLLRMRVSRGERVTVTPAGQSGPAQQVNVTIVTQDIRSFHGAEGNIAADVARILARARRNM